MGRFKVLEKGQSGVRDDQERRCPCGESAQGDGKSKPCEEPGL